MELLGPAGGRAAGERRARPAAKPPTRPTRSAGASPTKTGPGETGARQGGGGPVRRGPWRALHPICARSFFGGFFSLFSLLLTRGLELSGAPARPRFAPGSGKR